MSWVLKHEILGGEIQIARFSIPARPDLHWIVANTCIWKDTRYKSLDSLMLKNGPERVFVTVTSRPPMRGQRPDRKIRISEPSCEIFQGDFAFFRLGKSPLKPIGEVRSRLVFVGGVFPFTIVQGPRL